MQSSMEFIAWNACIKEEERSKGRNVSFNLRILDKEEQYKPK